MAGPDRLAPPSLPPNQSLPQVRSSEAPARAWVWRHRVVLLPLIYFEGRLVDSACPAMVDDDDDERRCMRAGDADRMHRRL